MSKNKTTNKLINAKRRKGLAFYMYGFKVVIPQGNAAPMEMTFTGSFTRRKLRGMIRKVLKEAGVLLTVPEIDFLIDNYGTKLRQVTMDELIASVEADDED
jgi:hypothetical protein